MTASLSDVQLAFVARLENDATFATRVGSNDDGELRFVYEWPEELIAKPVRTEFPRVTWQIADMRTRSADPEHLLIATDTWAIRASAIDSSEGLAKVNAIDDAMLALLFPDESAVTWFDIVREIYVSSVCLEGSSPPSRLIRRRRLWQIARA